MVTCCIKFLPEGALILKPLYNLLKKGTLWKWAEVQGDAFKNTKTLWEANVLEDHDPNTPLLLEGDASPMGIGAVLSHREVGMERPIRFRSRMLLAEERNYSQLQREVFALAFDVLKFRQYLLGQTFTLVTDHKPLVGLFPPERPIPGWLPQDRSLGATA